MTTTPAPGPTLGTLPSTFVPAAVPGTSCPAGGCAAPDATVGSWTGPERILVGAGSPAESLLLVVRTGPLPPVPGTTEDVRVRGHDGVLARLDCHGLGCTTLATVQWSEDATHRVQVQYVGPLTGSATGDPLTTTQLVAVADGYRPGA